MASSPAIPPVAAAGAGAASEPPTIHFALPKGHMQENIFALLQDAGYKVSNSSSRGYRPSIPLSNFDVKLLKPQNILGMLHTGSRDLGFAGLDWVQELGVDVVPVLDTGLDPVRIVAAAPNPRVLEEKSGFEGRKLIVASEYSNITLQWLEKKGIDADFLRAYGATESLPPEDADLIVDNTATGATLRANGLTILETVTTSSTHLFASAKAWANPAKRAIIEEFAMVLRSVLDARSRLMVAWNVSEANLDSTLAVVPEVRLPTVAPLHKGATVSPLHGSAGFAVQVVLSAKETPAQIVALKKAGATDIVVTNLKQIIA